MASRSPHDVDTLADPRVCCPFARSQRIIVFLGVDGVAKKVLGMAKRLQMYYAPYQWLGTEGSLGERMLIRFVLCACFAAVLSCEALHAAYPESRRSFAARSCMALEHRHHPVPAGFDRH